MPPPLLSVFLVRHTETTWNRISRYQGRIDSSLSDTGRSQVVQVVDSMGSQHFDLIYTSPLSRARTLADAISKATETQVVVDPRLTEIAMGPWEGLTRSEIEAEFRDMIEAWHDRPDTVTFPDGETIFQVAERVEDFMHELFVDQISRRVVVVSHDAVIKVALMLALGLELRHLHRFRIRNGSVSVLRGSYFVGSVEAIDTTAHLTGSPFDLLS